MNVEREIREANESILHGLRVDGYIVEAKKAEAKGSMNAPPNKKAHESNRGPNQTATRTDAETLCLCFFLFKIISPVTRVAESLFWRLALVKARVQTMYENRRAE